MPVRGTRREGRLGDNVEADDAVGNAGSEAGGAGDADCRGDFNAAAKRTPATPSKRQRVVSPTAASAEDTATNAKTNSADTAARTTDGATVASLLSGARHFLVSWPADFDLQSLHGKSMTLCDAVARDADNKPRASLCLVAPDGTRLRGGADASDALYCMEVSGATDDMLSALDGEVQVLPPPAPASSSRSAEPASAASTMQCGRDAVASARQRERQGARDAYESEHEQHEARIAPHVLLDADEYYSGSNAHAASSSPSALSSSSSLSLPPPPMAPVRPTQLPLSALRGKAHPVGGDGLSRTLPSTPQKRKLSAPPSGAPESEQPALPQVSPLATPPSATTLSTPSASKRTSLHAPASLSPSSSTKPATTTPSTLPAHDDDRPRRAGAPLTFDAARHLKDAYTQRYADDPKTLTRKILKKPHKYLAVHGYTPHADTRRRRIETLELQ